MDQRKAGDEVVVFKIAGWGKEGTEGRVVVYMIF